MSSTSNGTVAQMPPWLWASEVRVRVHKPQAPIKGAVFADVFVEVTRGRHEC